MTRKQQRIFAILIVLVGIGLAVTLSLFALRENVTYFHSPTEIYENHDLNIQGRVFRLGGLVAEGTVRREGTMTYFTVTDTIHSLPVQYEGLPPDLFREGQGVIATGRLDEEGIFHATRLLAKHDENYMPPEVAKALEEAPKGSNN
jgi:cytochrome c-type biogenesis protein CcmE